MRPPDVRPSSCFSSLYPPSFLSPRPVFLSLSDSLSLLAHRALSYFPVHLAVTVALAIARP